MNKVIVFLIVVIVGAGIYFSSQDLAEQPEAVGENHAAAEDTSAAHADTDHSEETTQLAKASMVTTDPGIAPVIYGSADAPVVIREYASFSCSHCATFHNERLPELKEKYIDSGKVRLEMNSFIRNQQDLRATMLIQCLEDNKKRQQFAKVLLKSQSQWAYSAEFVENLRTLAGVGGVSGEAFDACMANTELEAAAIQSRKIFEEEVKVPSTPFFVIHDKTIKGVLPIEEFEAIIDPMLAN